MAISLNARFKATVAADPEVDHPAGASLARSTLMQLRAKGWTCEELDNWRDVGWFFLCSRGRSRLEVVISAMGSEEWMMQVAPESVPGLIGRMLGKQASASAADVLDLAKAVHEVLSGERVLGMRWRWDGPPTPNSPAEPRA